MCIHGDTINITCNWGLRQASKSLNQCRRAQLKPRLQSIGHKKKWPYQENSY